MKLDLIQSIFDHCWKHKRLFLNVYFCKLLKVLELLCGMDFIFLKTRNEHIKISAHSSEILKNLDGIQTKWKTK